MTTKRILLVLLTTSTYHYYAWSTSTTNYDGRDLATPNSQRTSRRAIPLQAYASKSTRLSRWYFCLLSMVSLQQRSSRSQGDRVFSPFVTSVVVEWPIDPMLLIDMWSTASRENPGRSPSKRSSSNHKPHFLHARRSQIHIRSVTC